jgi:hypothetical protein
MRPSVLPARIKKKKIDNRKNGRNIVGKQIAGREEIIPVSARNHFGSQQQGHYKKCQSNGDCKYEFNSEHPVLQKRFLTSKPDDYQYRKQQAGNADPDITLRCEIQKSCAFACEVSGINGKCQTYRHADKYADF